MKREKMTVKERIQYYKDQGITEIAPLFHEPVIGDLAPDKVNLLQDGFGDPDGEGKELKLPPGTSDI